MRRLFSGFLLAFLALGVAAGEFSLSVAPAAQLKYRGEGKILPQGYVNRFEGNTAPLYRLDWRQDPRAEGFWGVGLWHTGVFGGGTYGRETVPDVAGGDYQSNSMNVGFDDVTEISAEGIGFGLAGTHGKKLYVRWQAAAHYYVQIFDAETDASAGSIFQGEAGVGWRITPRLSFEVGGLWQDWFILGQGNRRLHVEGTDGAVISYNRQQTTLSGLTFKLETRFGSHP